MTTTRSAVADQLRQPVADEDDDASGVGERMHPAEEVVRFLLGERRVGLIEQEHPGLLDERPGDLGPLVDGQRHILEQPVADGIDAQVAHDRELLLAQAPAQPAGALAARP